ncbi:MAG TPA: EAL domain-containing protein [Allosphingosinicella sp.]|jgi:EAL domain-containing protein (putative c-di-GMP-specific phosphodiesterase class I)
MSATVPRLTLAGLEEAAATGQLYLMYQPKLDLRSGAITGVEALARWQHPRRGEIRPVDFIPAVERGGLIDWFSEWALTSAARQWAEWRAGGLDLELAVNISALNLRHVCFPDVVATICAAEGVPHDRLMLELTEGATQEATRLMDTVTRFRLKGIGISLDDFGTGYGSLVQLRSLPFTELKIDRSFVADLLVSTESRAITRGLIAMAHEIGLIVTAEGVEDQDTLTALQAFGCDKAQGFTIARPMTGDRLTLWMARWGSVPGSKASDPPASPPVALRLAQAG